MDLYLPLPLELVLNVVSSSVSVAPSVLLPPSHPTTKLLLAFTLVCHRTRQVANRHIRDHCIVLEQGPPLQKYLLTIPARPDLCKIKTLSLSPFFADIDDFPRCSWVKELFFLTCDTLTKLVVDMPLRTCYPDEDHLGVRKLLRLGFESLVNLVEFVSIQDELYVDTYDREGAAVWAIWPKLKRLALYNVDASEDFWARVARHPSLEILVLTNPDGFLNLNAKYGYYEHATRPMTVVLCTWDDRFFNCYEADQDLDWVGEDTNRRLDLIVHEMKEFADCQTSRPQQLAIKAAAHSGELWEWRGA